MSDPAKSPPNTTICPHLPRISPQVAPQKQPQLSQPPQKWAKNSKTHPEEGQKKIRLFSGSALRIYGERVLAIERADRLHRTLLPIALRPDLIVRILGQLAKTVRTLIVRDKAFHCKTMPVLQIDHGPLQGCICLVHNLTLHHPLHRAALLRQQGRIRRSQGECRERTGPHNQLTGNGTQQIKSTLHTYQYTATTTHLPRRQGG